MHFTVSLAGLKIIVGYRYIEDFVVQRFVTGEQLQNTPQLTPFINLLLPWSEVRSRLYVLSVKLKCYRGPQPRSR